MCALIHCTTTTAMHTSCYSCNTLGASRYSTYFTLVVPRTLLSHSTLGAAFHQNFTPILTITQLVTVRSNHSESENHDRAPIDKATPVRCNQIVLHRRRVKFEWIDKISFGNPPDGFPAELCETRRGPKIGGKTREKCKDPSCALPVYKVNCDNLLKLSEAFLD